MNIIIEHFNYLESTVKNKQELIDKKLDYIINEVLPIEIAKAIREKIDDGTIKVIVSNNICTAPISDDIESNATLTNDI